MFENRPEGECVLRQFMNTYAVLFPNRTKEKTKRRSV